MDLIALLVPSLTIIISFAFYFGQNKKENIGGKMAPCKLFWLDYTIMTWFFLPLYFYFSGYTDGVFNVLYALSISMWIRGIIELFMLYVTKNWTPPLGITHNIITIIIVLAMMYLSIMQNPAELIFVISLLISLLLETYYAVAFYKIVKEKTKGDDAIWFASKENPKFAFILKVTTIGNLMVYGALAYFLQSLF